MGEGDLLKMEPEVLLETSISWAGVERDGWAARIGDHGLRGSPADGLSNNDCWLQDFCGDSDALA